MGTDFLFKIMIKKILLAVISIFSKRDVEEVKAVKVETDIKRKFTLEEIIFDVNNFNAWCKSNENKTYPDIYLKINSLSKYVFIKYMESYGIENGGPFMFDELSHLLIKKFEVDVRIDWREKKDVILDKKRRDKRKQKSNK